MLSGQSSISWMGFTHTNNNSEDDVIGIPLWCTDIDRFMEFMHDGIEHSSISEDNHLAKITVSPTLQVYSTENENSVPWMVTLVAIADGRAWEGLIKNILAGLTGLLAADVEEEHGGAQPGEGLAADGYGLEVEGEGDAQLQLCGGALGLQQLGQLSGSNAAEAEETGGEHHGVHHLLHWHVVAEGAGGGEALGEGGGGDDVVYRYALVWPALVHARQGDQRVARGGAVQRGGEHSLCVEAA